MTKPIPDKAKNPQLARQLNSHIKKLRSAANKAFDQMAALTSKGSYAGVDTVRKNLAQLLTQAQCSCPNASSQPQGQAAQLKPGTKQLTRHQVAVYVVERVKRGSNMLMSTICTEIYEKFGGQAYGVCNEVLTAINTQGHNVRAWLFEGMYEPKTKKFIVPATSSMIATALGFPK